MSEGPGRYYHPGMFPIITDIIDRRDLAPGTYNLWDLAPGHERDESVKASVSHYFTDLNSEDYKTRALVFGNESARISGMVDVNHDGSKTFHGVEIRPFDTDFNFDPKKAGMFTETARARAKQLYDPYNQGASYDIPFSGNGRTYEPFTDSQLRAALQREFVHPGSGPPYLLPSAADSTPPFLKNYLEYLNRVGTPATPPDDGTPEIPGDNSASASSRGCGGQSAGGSFGRCGRTCSEVRFIRKQKLSQSGIANWIAGIAGVDPANPTQPAPQPADRLPGLVSNEPTPDWPFPPPIFNPRRR